MCVVHFVVAMFLSVMNVPIKLTNKTRIRKNEIKRRTSDGGGVMDCRDLMVIITMFFIAFLIFAGLKIRNIEDCLDKGGSYLEGGCYKVEEIKRNCTL